MKSGNWAGRVGTKMSRLGGPARAQHDKMLHCVRSIWIN